ncbi:MAG: hypothetical protein EA376_07040 [Phycisphaeraceae bacterium]|nr:MAG: hypothetical protein EA376_07040 [Phycisphaeraceae bacterium]
MSMRSRRQLSHIWIFALFAIGWTLGCIRIMTAPPGGMSHHMQVLFAAPFVIFGVGVWWIVLALIRAEFFPPPMGGVIVIDNPGRTLVRSRRMHPLAWSLIAAFASSLLASIIIVFALGWHPQPSQAHAAWIIIVIVSAAAFIASALRGGSFDVLTIDDDQGMVELAPSSENRAGMCIATSDIRSVVVRDFIRIDLHDSDGTERVISVDIEHTDGERHHTAFVCGFTGVRSAEAFAAWLRERLKLAETEPRLSG